MGKCPRWPRSKFPRQQREFRSESRLTSNSPPNQPPLDWGPTQEFRRSGRSKTTQRKEGKHLKSRSETAQDVSREGCTPAQPTAKAKLACKGGQKVSKLRIEHVIHHLIRHIYT